MKKIILFTLLTIPLFANDPTILKGKLKKVLEEKIIPIKDAVPEPQIKKAEIDKRLQEGIEQLVFKAFYYKDSTKELMVELAGELIILEQEEELMPMKNIELRV